MINLIEMNEIEMNEIEINFIFMIIIIFKYQMI